MKENTELPISLHKEMQSFPPYSKASSFTSEQPAKRAYLRVQETIFAGEEDLELGAFNLLVSLIPYVVVLGEEPPPEIDRQLSQILATGEPAILPTDILSRLNAHRLEAKEQGSWVERHYRPGEILP